MGYSLTVRAWGTKQGNSAYGSQISRHLFGGNVGHVSLGVTFPADERGQELVKKYCDAHQIPYQLKHRTTYVSEQVGDKWVKTDKIMHSESYYEVYWSWWPGGGTHDLTSDQIHERLGAESLYHALDAKDVRRYKGFIGSRRIALSPKAIVTIPDNIPQAHQELLQQYSLVQENIRVLWNEIHQYRKKRIKEEGLGSDYPIEQMGMSVEHMKRDTELNQQLGQLEQDLLDPEHSYLKRFITIGANPNNTVSLPILDSQLPQHQSQDGFELEAILQNMVRVKNDDVDFDLHGKSCVATVLSILAGGLREKDAHLRKKVIKMEDNYRKSSGLMFTPQAGVNISQQLAKEIGTPHKKPKGFIKFLKSILNYFRKKPAHEQQQLPPKQYMTHQFSQSTRPSRRPPPPPPPRPPQRPTV